MTTWQERESPHVAECELCQRQLASPQPCHEDLCHMNIRPDDPHGELPVIQCPHLAEPGSDTKSCARHIEMVVAAYLEWCFRMN